MPSISDDIGDGLRHWVDAPLLGTTMVNQQFALKIAMIIHVFSAFLGYPHFWTLLGSCSESGWVIWYPNN
jgi:hypothetical protein